MLNKLRDWAFVHLKNFLPSDPPQRGQCDKWRKNTVLTKNKNILAYRVQK